MIDDESDEVNQRLEMPVLADKLNLFNTGYYTMAFLEKDLSNIDQDNLNLNILEESTKDLEKVYQ